MTRGGYDVEAKGREGAEDGWCMSGRNGRNGVEEAKDGGAEGKAEDGG